MSQTAVAVSSGLRVSPAGPPIGAPAHALGGEADWGPLFVSVSAVEQRTGVISGSRLAAAACARLSDITFMNWTRS